MGLDNDIINLHNTNTKLPLYMTSTQRERIPDKCQRKIAGLSGTFFKNDICLGILQQILLIINITYVLLLIDINRYPKCEEVKANTYPYSKVGW